MQDACSVKKIERFYFQQIVKNLRNRDLFAMFNVQGIKVNASVSPRQLLTPNSDLDFQISRDYRTRHALFEQAVSRPAILVLFCLKVRGQFRWKATFFMV